MNVSIIVATHGHTKWKHLARTRALPSAHEQDAHEVIEYFMPGTSLFEVRNAAARTATGDWLCFLDADDELAPGYLPEMSYALVEHGIYRAERFLLVPSVQYVRRSKGVVGFESEPRIPDWDRSLYDLNCACIGTLIPRLLFEEAGGFGDEPIYEDWALVLRCVLLGAVLLPVPAAVYRATDQPGSRNKGQLARDTYKAIRSAYRDVPRSVWDAAKQPLSR